MRRFLNSVTGSSFFGDDESRTEDVILIQHGRDTLNITFPKGEVSTTGTVRKLRTAVQDALGLPHEHSIKLVFSGQTLKDDDALLSSYNLKHGSKILCMASKSRLPASTPSSTTSSPAATVRKAAEPPKKKKIIPPMEMIELVRKHVHGTVLPLVEEYEKDTPTDQTKRTDEHHRLSETVLGEMLKLDSVDVDGVDGTEVRKKRKETVKELHGMLERLDKAKNSVPT